MVGWKTQLSEADITRLADYVLHALRAGQARRPRPAQAISGTAPMAGARPMHTGSTPVRVDMTAGLPNGLKGDARRGGAFYLANCATCHGARGDGAGPRAYFINPKPRNFVEDALARPLNRIALYAAVSEGRNWAPRCRPGSKVATPQQMADVAEYVFQTLRAGPDTLAQAAGHGCRHG